MGIQADRETIRILIADDERLVRAGYRMILQPEPDLDVVGEAGNGIEAVEQARALHPDVVLMDVRMPRLDGIAATRSIRATEQPPAVLVVTTFDLDEYVFQALRAGASGFLLKDAPESQLLAALRATRDGGALFSPTITRRLIETFVSAHHPVRDHRLDTLTDRETHVLTHLALGLSNAEIADALYISETTVKTHVSRILTKLALTSRTQAVVAAYEWRLITPGQAHLPTGPPAPA